MSLIIINDDNYKDYIGDIVVDGEHKARGLVPRDYSKIPQGFYSSAPPWSTDVPLIPKSEWSDRIKEKEKRKSRLSDIRKRANGGKGIPSLDQGGYGFCWSHSPTIAAMLLRAKANFPYVRLSAYAIACIIKQYRDEGGWGAHALDFIANKGVPSVEFWPEKSVARSNDKPETWANAALHKVTEGWADINAAVYDRDLTFNQVATALLLNYPVIGDFNWWGHSICLMDLVEVERGSFGVRFINSWSDQWGEKGEGILQGNKAIPDGATAARVITASIKSIDE